MYNYYFNDYNESDEIQQNYFKSLIEDVTYDFSLNNDEFKIKYNIDLNFNNKKNSVICLILSQINIKKKYIDLFLKTSNNIDDEIIFIFKKIIKNRNILLFKYLESKYNITNLLDYYQYNNTNINLVNYSLTYSNQIFNYIFKNYNIFITLYLNPKKIMLPIDGNVDSHKPMLNNLIQNYNEDHNSVIIEFISHIYNSNYDLADYLVYKINDIEIFNNYLCLNIKNLFIENIKFLLKKRSLIIPKLNFTKILENLYNICSNKLRNESFNYVTIINMWKLLFPLIKEKLTESDIKSFFYRNPINFIVSLKNGKKIIKLIEPYIIEWNIHDEYNFTPIMDCVKYGTIDTLRYLLNKYHFNFNDISYGNENIITCAINNTNIKIFHYLIDFIKKENINLDDIILINQINYPLYLTPYIDRNKIYLFLNLLNSSEKYIILNTIINKNIYNKKFVMELINKFKIKIQLNSFENYLYKSENHIDEVYLKFIIDNLEIVDYKKTLSFFTNYGCFSKIKNILDYLLIKYPNYNYYLKENDIYSNIINDVFHKQRQIIYDKPTLFKDYILYLRNKIFKTKTIYYENLYYIKYYNYEDIKLLFMNGIFPSKPSYNFSNPKLYYNYTFSELPDILNELIQLKKESIGNYNYYFKWNIVILVLKTYVRKKFNKLKDNHLNKLKLMNTEFNFSKNLKYNTIINNSFKPEHIKPLDLYKNIHETHLYISQKADGLYKKKLFGLYPKLPNNINLDNFEYEYVKQNNMCYIFNNLEEDNYNSVSLRYNHKYITKHIFPSLNLNNYKIILEDYKKYESEALFNYISQNQKIKKWWPKYIFKIDNMSKIEYIKLLSEISKINLDLDFIPNDGWILKSFNNVLKIKPNHLLTIDLVYKKNNLYDSDNNSYLFNSNIDLKNNKIYRCYFNKTLNLWEPKDIRIDKFKPNNMNICKYIELNHKYKWSFSDINLNDSYYQNNYSLRNNNYKKEHILFKTFNKNDSILDLGCGYRGIKNNNYVGLDIDPKVLVNKNHKNIFICDIKNEWNKESQLKIYNNIYYYLPNIDDFKIKYNNTKFNTILSVNSIHYFVNNKNNISIFFKNINSYVTKDSQFIIRFLDKDLLNILLESDYISNGSSFIRKINDNKIKIYYDWTHNNPIEEEIFNVNELKEIFENNGWTLKKYNYKQLNYNLSRWDMYFECFSNIIFTKK